MNNYGEPSADLDFGQSISTCLKKYAVFDGRASRSEFWPYFFVYTFGSLILDVSTEATQMPIIGIVALIVSLGGMLPMISVGCRRMHDINKSGWWQLIPIYNLILWAQGSSEGSTNKSSTRSSDFSEPTQNRSANNDLTDELEELEELYKDGTLSEAQFKKAKNKLLK